MLAKIFANGRFKLMAKEAAHVLAMLNPNMISHILICAALYIFEDDLTESADAPTDFEKLIEQAPFYSYDERYAIYLEIEHTRDLRRKISVPYYIQSRDIYVHSLSIWCVYFAYFLNPKILREKRLLSSLLQKGLPTLDLSLSEILGAKNPFGYNQNDILAKRVRELSHKIPELIWKQ